ncbi:MAG: hypothetical protein AAGA48_19415 [Myxococcota bacterium]
MSAIPAALHAALQLLPTPEAAEESAPTEAVPRSNFQPVGNPFLQRFALHRMLGAFVAATGVLEAKRGASYHAWLHRLRLLDRLPGSWSVESVVDTLPVIGSRPVAPCPDLPPGVTGPWPQRPVLAPGLYSPVMNLSREEEQRHLSFNVLRYLGQATTTLPRAVWKASARARLAEMNDVTFASLLQDTTYAQYICKGLDPKDLHPFRHLLRRPASEYYKVDFELFAEMQTIDPEMPQTGSVTLLERDSTGRFWPLAIQLGDRVIEPQHGPAWELARYFVLQHAATQTVVVWHPRLHFPCDAVHAITLSLLPDGHPIKRLMLPHTPLTLGLHQAVMHNHRSVFHNNQREIFAPMAYTTKAIRDAAAKGRAGIAGNRGYPEYRWGDDLLGDHVSYGHYRREWAAAFFRLCEGALAQVSSHDRAVAAWADHISAFVPGFPDSSVIFQGDTLAQAVSTWMRGVTAFHTADHYSYGRIPMKWSPLRVRAPLPHPDQTERVPVGRLVSREDRLRQVLAHELFFRPTVIYRLSEVQYDVEGGRAQHSVDRFFEEVAAIDAEWSTSSFPTSDQIGASIHY